MHFVISTQPLPVEHGVTVALQALIIITSDRFAAMA